MHMALAILELVLLSAHVTRDGSEMHAIYAMRRGNLTGLTVYLATSAKMICAMETVIAWPIACSGASIADVSLDFLAPRVRSVPGLRGLKLLLPAFGRAALLNSSCLSPVAARTNKENKRGAEFGFSALTSSCGETPLTQFREHRGG